MDRIYPRSPSSSGIYYGEQNEGDEPMKTIALYLIVMVALIVGFLMMANADAQEEVLIFRPDGTAEYCTTYDDGTTYCR